MLGTIFMTLDVKDLGRRELVQQYLVFHGYIAKIMRQEK